jgi:hypothetical protein
LKVDTQSDGWQKSMDNVLSSIEGILSFSIFIMHVMLGLHMLRSRVSVWFSSFKTYGLKKNVIIEYACPLLRTVFFSNALSNEIL